MADYTEGRHPGEVILREANGTRSREVITIASGHGVVQAGTVVGEITLTKGSYAPSPATGSDGTQVAKAVTLYTVDATSAAVKVAALLRDAEINGSCLEYDSTIDTAAKETAKKTQLLAVGLISR